MILYFKLGGTDASRTSRLREGEVEARRLELDPPFLDQLGKIPMCPEGAFSFQCAA